ncbi:protein FAM221B-like isoform X1 [Clavelina lepadiformis]|uniref:protein FAM221B-like isoform X1 n=1 Tax=Clavelina lepadiformis TaxID=159417 RepID=UPI0040417434
MDNTNNIDLKNKKFSMNEPTRKNLTKRNSTSYGSRTSTTSYSKTNGKPARRPVTSGTINVGEGLSENGDGGLEKDKFHPGRAGFSGTKLQVQRRSYTAQPIVPAEKPELISVAESMHRDKFGKRLQKMFEPETAAAIKAMESGIYVGWRCPEYTWDCIRVAETSLCFCGHKLNEHKQYSGPKSQVPCAVSECRCRVFAFVPSRPEDVGEFWLQRRRGYDRSTWKAKCRCKHTHIEHAPTGVHQCNVRNCRCGQFVSSFLCAACDRHWEQHVTYFDTERSRVKKGLPHGEAYIPFAEIPRLRNMALTGKGNDSSSYKALTNSKEPTSNGSNSVVNNNTPVPFGYHKPKKSPFE